MVNPIVSYWNGKQKRLREIINKEAEFENAMQTVEELHSMVHSKQVTGKESSYYDSLVIGLNQEIAEVMPTKKDVTIIWNLWHITRIEDITVNILIDNGNQILDQNWLKRLNTAVTDTGNAMTDEEIIGLSKSIPIKELLDYRDAVGCKTKEVLARLCYEDLKRKFNTTQADRIVSENGLTGDPGFNLVKRFLG